MPILLENELGSMKLNGCDSFKQNSENEKHTNGTDNAENLPSEMLVSDGLPECSLCDIKFHSVTEYEAHSVTLQHAQRVLQQNSFIALPSDEYNTLTNPFNKSEKTSVVKLNEHNQGEKNSGSSKTDSVCLVNEASKPPGPPQPYSCSYCIKNFSGPEPYKQHLESKAHKKKIALESNSFAEIKKTDGIIFCDLCKIECTGEKPYNEHKKSKKHRMNMNQVLEKNTDEDFVSEAKKMKMEYRTEEKRQWFCEVCKIQCSGPAPYSQHCNGNNHKKRKAMSETAKSSSDLVCTELSRQNVQFLIQDSEDDSAPEAKKFKIEAASKPTKQFYCELCRKQCTGLVPYTQHIEGSEHKRNVARSQAGGSTEPSININQLLPLTSNKSNVNHENISAKSVSDSVSSDNIANTIVAETSDKLVAGREGNVKETVELKSAWFCTDCNVQCTGPFNFSQHVGGKSHRKKLNLLQKRNVINEPKDMFDGTKSSVNGLAEEISYCSQEQNNCTENIDYERVIEPSIKVFSPDEEINFD